MMNTIETVVAAKGQRDLVRALIVEALREGRTEDIAALLIADAEATAAMRVAMDEVNARESAAQIQ